MIHHLFNIFPSGPFLDPKMDKLTFHNFRSTKSVVGRVLCFSEMSNGGFRGYDIANVAIGTSAASRIAP